MITITSFENKTIVIRGKPVLLDKDLAKLFGITAGSLNLGVKRNEERFTSEFVFRLTPLEYEKLMRNQVVRPKKKFAGLPLVYTWQGACMVSSVLNNRIAICVHMQ